MSKQLYFFDIDGTLWTTNSKVWIIDKENPSKPIKKLNFLDFKLIQDGIYKEDNIKTEYNDNTYFISQDLFDKIQKLKHIPEERLGISFAEFFNNDLIKEIKIILSNVRHLSSKGIDIALLSGRFDRKGDSKFLNDLRLELKSINIGLNKIFYVGKSLNSLKHSENVSRDKAKVILEHFIGYEIDKNKFSSTPMEAYSEIFFYDDEETNIQYALNLQEYLQDLLFKTDDETYKKIIERVKNNKLILHTYLITPNDVNKFKASELIITEPIKYPIKENHIKNFTQFLNEKYNL